MNWTISQTVDLAQGYTPVVWPNALMVSGDVGAHTWRVTVLDGGAAASLAGATITGSFLRDDGATVQVAGSASGNIASVTLTDACYAVEGKLVGTMRAVISGSTVTLAAVVYTVKLLTSGSVINPGVAYQDFQIDASPAGTYANLDALNAGTPAAPDVTKIYITLDDGNWRYHNGTTWVDGGVYQSVLLADKTAQLIPAASSLPDYNTATNVLDFKSTGNAEDQVAVYCMGQAYWLPEGTTVTNTVNDTSARVLWFDFATKTFSFQGYSYAPKSTEYFLGTLRGWINPTIWFPIWTGTFDITIDGGKQAKDDDFFFVPSSLLPDYNSATNVLDFKSTTADKAGVYCKGQWYWLPEGTTVTNTVNDTSIRVLWFDFATKTFSFQGYSYAPKSTEYFLGTLKGWIQPTIWLPIWTGTFDITIDGQYQGKDDNFFFVPSSLLPDYNSTTNVLDFKSASLSDPGDKAGIYFDREWYWIPSGTTVDCSTGGTTTVKMLIFDKITKEFHVEGYTYPVSPVEIIIGTFKRNFDGRSGVEWTLPFAITVDGIYQNSSGGSPLPDIDANKISDFCELFKTVEGDAQSFLFFTDTHTFNLPTHEADFRSKLAIIESAYKNTPTSCVIFGGDWMTNSATKRQACTVLGKIDAITNTRFDGKFYNVLGNHDTNYQGRDLPESEDRTGTLTERAITHLLYRDYGKSYYTFKQGNSTNYVMDTGSDWVLTMDAYRWEQVDWFAKGLKSDDSDHSALFMHIGWSSYAHTLVPMTDEVTKIANAYNTRTSITRNGITYDFSTCTGTFSFVYTGHMHEEDYDALINGIRVIVTMHAYKSTPHTFDLCLVDYAAQKLKTVRIGFGDNRSIDIS